MSGEVTQMLQAACNGDAAAADQLLPLVYEELRLVAASKMARENPGQTLQATALVHEAWMKLAGKNEREWNGRTHFFAAAAEAMRRILIDRARRKKVRADVRGVDGVEVDEIELKHDAPVDELIAVDEVLGQLAEVDTDAARLVKLRYFVGLTMQETADAMNLPLRNTERLWTFARAWLHRRLKSDSMN